MKIAFIHPDLGIGGAERLVVDAAVALQEEENDVTIYTSHCDKTHCFEEVSNGTLKVVVKGDFLPTNILGRFHIVFAALRQLYLCLWLILSGECELFELFILDQLPYCLPLLHYNKRGDAKTLFYCHFPDQLLAPHDSLLRAVYRKLFDSVEEFTTGCSDEIVVNSYFTRSVFKRTFRSLHKVDPQVIYPCVATDVTVSPTALAEVAEFFQESKLFLSVNRFERKKNVSLAIKAFAEVAKTNKDVKLIVAGGYDARVRENVEYLIELETLCSKLGLKSISIRGKLIAAPRNTTVFFLPSVSSELKDALIAKCEMLLYTPSFEHFGIVPIEAMRLGKIVLATDTGGPLESVENHDGGDDWTGFTVTSDFGEWAKVMNYVIGLSTEEKTAVAKRAIARVDSMFSRESMKVRFLETIQEMRPQRFAYELYVEQTVKMRLLLFVLALYGIYKSLT